MVKELEAPELTRDEIIAQREHGAMRIPLLTKLKVRNLYLNQDLLQPEIATITGLSYTAVRNLIAREEWGKLKAAKRAALERNADARIAAQVAESAEAIASECEEIALGGLDRTRESLADTGKDAAKNFQAFSGGVKNLVTVMRELRSVPEENNHSLSVNILIARCGVNEAKQVSEASESVPTSQESAPVAEEW